jgi:hypothetical protein
MKEDGHSYIGSVFAASRGLAIFISILWHVDTWISRSEPGYKVHEGIFRFLWYIPLPLFFFLVGLSFSGIIRRARIGVIANAIGSYAYLYVVWAIIYHILFFLVGNEDYGVGLVPNIRHILLPAPELWFVLWLACCLALCTITARLPREWQLAAALLAAVAIPGPGYKIQNFGIYNLLFVYAGLFLREPFIEALTRYSRPIFLVCAPVYAVIAFVMIPMEPFSETALALLLSVLGIGAVLSGLVLVHRAKAVEGLAWLGRRAFHVYLVAPLWVALDLRLLSRVPSLHDPSFAAAVQGMTLPLCLIVLGQALFMIHVMGRRSRLLSPPAALHRTIEGAVARLLVRTTIPPFGAWRGIGRRRAGAPGVPPMVPPPAAQ